MADSLVNFFKKFWLQSKIEDTLLQTILPKTDVSSYLVSDKETRIYTVEIYNNDTTPATLIASDNGAGILTAVDTGIFSSATGDTCTFDYTNSTVTIYWDSTYLAGFTLNPYIRFKYISSTLEEHAEMLDFLGQVFQYYKTEELDKRADYYNPEEIPFHLIDRFASDHNWVIDRLYSEEETYLRTQLKYMFDLYKSKRTLNSIDFAIAVINRRVNLYNLVAKKSNYDDYSQYVLFDTKTLFETFEAASPGTDKEVVAAQIQAIYDSLYDPSSSYYPTKHFLLDLALDILTTEGDLLSDIDIPVLKWYILKVKSKTQYPHLQSYLGIYTDASDRYQDGSIFQFKLTTAEQIFSISPYRPLTSGPYPVESIAALGGGAWVILPLIMNNALYMNTGLMLNMQLGDVDTYLTSFQIGSDSWSTLSPSMTSLKAPFYTSYNMSIIYDTDYYYLTLILDENEGNAYPIKEVGIFSDQGILAFYIKHPTIYKTDTHKHIYRLKIKVSGYLP